MTMTGSAICSHNIWYILAEISAMTSEDFRSWRDGETAESHADGGGSDLYLFGGAGSDVRIG